jgi:N-methylhydantoinase A/oxoprolinase/acetone carboxylase beta subunit
LNSQCVAVANGAQEEDPLFAWLAANGPATAAMLRQALDMPESQLDKSITRLCSRRSVVTCGFTPTDALHVLGKLNLGEREPARRGAEILAGALGISPEAFCTQILGRAEQTIATTILTALSTREVGSALAQFMTSGQDNPLLEISIRLKPEIIGIGAGSPYFLPGAAKLLGTTVHFPDHYDVGNAVGAALMDSIITKEG